MAWTTPRTWTDGELVTASIMNTHVRDELNLVSHVIRKTADESVTSSVTLQDDDHLTFSIAANEVWSVEGFLWATSASATPDFGFGFGVPAGATFQIMGWSINTAGSWGGSIINAAAESREVDVSTTDGGIGLFRGVVVNGGTAGSARVTWAQVTSSATATVLKANSYMYICKLA